MRALERILDEEKLFPEAGACSEVLGDHVKAGETPLSLPAR